MRFTTRVLRALRHLVSLHEYGFLHALVDCALSYSTGRGSASYRAIAKVAKISRRQAIRYVQRLVARGLLIKTLQYQVGQRPLHERNRANLLYMPLPVNAEDRAFDPETEAFIAATQGDDFGAAGAPEQSDDVTALDAAADVAPFESDENTPGQSARGAAAQVVAAPPPSLSPCSTAAPTAEASRPASSPVPVNDALGPEATSVLQELGAWPQLGSIAMEAAAGRIWGVGCRYKKNLATVLSCVRDGADKASGRTGPLLESVICGFVRVAHEVTAAPAKKSTEQLATERAVAAERARGQAERDEEDRQKRLRAARVLASKRGPPPPTTPTDQ